MPKAVDGPGRDARRPGAALARGLAVAALALAAAAGVVPAHAAATILHEFVEPSPGEDLKLSATTLDGDLPAAIDTPSGIATAPDPTRPPDPVPAYGGGTTDDAPGSTYEPDRDTRRPEVEAYDDPFSPSTAPFKRLRAFDSVDASYRLRVADLSLAALAVGGVASRDDEPFYADFTVQLLAGQPVRIPTVGPDARVLKMHVEPSEDVTLLRDGADNWFARGKRSASVRMVMELAIRRATFGSPFADPSFDQLSRFVPPVHSRQAEAASRVFDAIGVSRAMRPREAVQRMVAYFRSFAPSDTPPNEHGDIYLDLALSKKGVCRHRAFAFLVTALHLGIPTRMVVNEAHAWVEVFDGRIWHRIDLGGAALDLEQDADPERPMHRPPADPYEWPPGSQDGSGQDLAEREHEAMEAAAPGDPGASSDPAGADPATDPAAQDPAGKGTGADPLGAAAPAVTAPPGWLGDPSQVDPTQAPDPASSAAEAAIVVESTEREARRGRPTRLKGRITSPSGPCARLRLDVVLASPGAAPGGRRTRIGSLSTDDDGVFDGSVVVPRDVAAGDYELVVETPGDARCSAARTD
jgi:hypothetical protein